MCIYTYCDVFEAQTENFCKDPALIFLTVEKFRDFTSLLKSLVEELVPPPQQLSHSLGSSTFLFFTRHFGSCFCNLISLFPD
jgi:hypothetical protein